MESYWPTLVPFGWLKRYRAVTALVLFLTLLAGTAQAFFPATPPPPNQGVPGTPPPTEQGGGGSMPPPGSGPPPENFPPIQIIPVPVPPPQPGGGNKIPEIDPGCIASALGLFISGALMLTDRWRRK